MASTDIVLSKLAEADVPRVAEVLASAFADNPAYAWMHPRRETRPRDLRAFFERNLRWHLPLDLTWVVRRGGRVVGTSTLELPGGVPSGVTKAIAHWLWPTVRHQGLRTFVRTATADREFRSLYGALSGANATFVRCGWRGFSCQKDDREARVVRCH